MLTAPRTLLIASCLAIAAATGCGGGPTAPSGAAGATVAGTVSVSGAAALTPARSALAPRGGVVASRASAFASPAAASELTVTVVGTNLSAVVDASGYFQVSGVPPGTIQLLFKGGSVSASAELSDVGQEELIEIEVQVSGTSATIVSEVRSNEKVSMCHHTGTGAYHLINVSVNAEPAHRAHGDGTPGGPVPDEPLQVFDASCKAMGPAVRIEKSTNGEDADKAPGPKIPIGDPVTWEYVVTNTGTVDLSNVVVTDDQTVTIECPESSLLAGESMTCTGSDVASEGQYRNVGTVTADSPSGQVSDSDASHYFGQMPGDEGPKVKLCHRTGNGEYVPIEVGLSAEPAHRAHGDGQVGEEVPDMTGKVFGAGCTVN